MQNNHDNDDVSSTSSSQALVHTPNGVLSTETFTVMEEKQIKTTEFNRNLKRLDSDVSQIRTERVKIHKKKIKKDTYDLPTTTQGWIIYYFRKYSIIMSLVLCGGLIWLFKTYKNKHPDLVKSEPSQILSNYQMPTNFSENSIWIEDSGRIDQKNYYKTHFGK